MMILHNLKVAWRNLMKYKTQNLVSIVALAVGIVTLAAIGKKIYSVSRINAADVRVVNI